MQVDGGGGNDFDSVPPSPRNLLYGQLSVPVDVRAVLNDDGFVEEERQLLSGVRVRAATVTRLVALVVDCFAESARYVINRKRCDTSADDADKEFPRVMFLMHQWFMSSKDLAELFMDLYSF